jgi:glycine hydroxymethyltransferase
MRGLDPDDFAEVGEIIAAALREDADLGALRHRIDAILERRPLYEGMISGHLVREVS